MVDIREETPFADVITYIEADGGVPSWPIESQRELARFNVIGQLVDIFNVERDSLIIMKEQEQLQEIYTIQLYLDAEFKTLWQKYVVFNIG